MELKIWMRKKQLFSAANPLQPVVYSGGNPQTIVTTPGLLPNNNWIDYTQDVNDLTRLELQWTERYNSAVEVAAIGQGVKLTSSSVISFSGAAYQFIKSWLVENVAATLNSVEVKIEFVGCAYFEGWVIRHSQITWCDGGICTYDAQIQQGEEQYQCIETTLINDNWQGWFPTNSRTPANGKKHPRISYCNEVRPNGLLTVQWYLMTTIYASSSMFIGIMLTIINPIIAVVNAIISVVNTLGGNISWNVTYINPSDILKGWAQNFIESGGCGREHPSPLIRDYITNVCDRCGVTVNASTAPIFFAATLNLETSSGDTSFPNDYYNLVYLFAPHQRGIRRFRNLRPIGYGPKNDTDYWIPENAPDIALSDFLNQLKEVFNAEWRLRNGTLYFDRKDAFKSDLPVYDFRPGQPDVSKLLKGICYRYNDAKYPAYTSGFYTQDGGDNCGNEARDQMNGFALSFTQYEKQPNFGGKLEKEVQAGATKFNLDGASTCYYYDALQVTANGGIVTLLSLGAFMPWIMANWIQVLQTAGDGFREFGDHALLLQGENCLLPKFICWDGKSFDNARAVITKAAWDGVSPHPMPDPNPAYNTALQPWKVRHSPKTDVIGKDLTFPPNTPGKYKVTDYFGIDITNNPAYLVNYPMYYEPFYKGTLWDRFHYIDDPRRNPIFNTEFVALLKLCCEDIIRLGIENDAANNQLGQLIKVPASTFYYEGKITQIKLVFDPTDEYGMHIEITGLV